MSYLQKKVPEYQQKTRSNRITHHITRKEQLKDIDSDKEMINEDKMIKI